MMMIDDYLTLANCDNPARGQKLANIRTGRKKKGTQQEKIEQRERKNRKQKTKKSRYKAKHTKHINSMHMTVATEECRTVWSKMLLIITCSITNDSFPTDGTNIGPPDLLEVAQPLPLHGGLGAGGVCVPFRKSGPRPKVVLENDCAVRYLLPRCSYCKRFVLPT